MKQILLFDIEGTTTDIAFVHKTLFPYALERMQDFVHSHPTHSAVTQVGHEIGSPGDLKLITQALADWIHEDRKHPALKEIQGLIWDEGYAKQDFRGHVYPDVRSAWERWKSQGHRLGIYSSGSVHAQKAIFRHSISGDLTGYLSAHFDTAVGGKRESSSYQKIAEALSCQTSDVVFFSDITEELDAAKSSGMHTIQVLREGASAISDHVCVRDFSAVILP